MSSLPVQSSLLENCQYLQDRADVEECVKDMLIDVELAATLADRLQSAHEIQRLQRRVDEQEVALAEARELQSHTSEHQTRLADCLLEDLISLSDEIGRLKETKQKHEELLVQYDETVAKLLSTEERLHDERERRANEQSLRKQNAEEKANQARMKEAAVPAPEETSAPFPAEEPDGGESADEVKLAPSIETVVDDTPPDQTSPGFEDTQLKSSGQATEPEPGPEIIDKDDTLVASNESVPAEGEAAVPPVEVVESPTKPATEPTAEPNAVEIDDTAAVVLLDENPIDAPLRFEKMDTEVLMKVFAYLDALDILNAAQINLHMYNRVDALFGLGDDSSPAEDNSTIETVETPALQPTVVALPPAKQKPAPTPAPASAQQPTVATIPEKKKPPPPVTEPMRSITPPRVAANLFSMLQPRRPQATPVQATPPPPKPTPPPRSSPPSTSSALPMNAAMANSMAAKLSDAELNAIIIMTERLKQKETMAAQLSQEKDELVAKLEGTENVKEFLIAKVRNMEITISASVENEMKVAQQIVSDQEVIAFLDSRVQELERETRDFQQEKQASQDSAVKLKKLSNEKASLLEDTLRYEREKLKESEREWKATKKVLVKEVKSCRAQIVSLQAERDQYREELEQALIHNSNGSSPRQRDRLLN